MMESKAAENHCRDVCYVVILLFLAGLIAACLVSPRLRGIIGSPVPSGAATFWLLYAGAQYVVCWLALERPRPRLRGGWGYRAFLAALGVTGPGVALLALVDGPAHQALMHWEDARSVQGILGTGWLVGCYGWMLALSTLCGGQRHGEAGVTG